MRLLQTDILKLTVLELDGPCFEGKSGTDSRSATTSRKLVQKTDLATNKKSILPFPHFFPVLTNFARPTLSVSKHLNLDDDVRKKTRRLRRHFSVSGK